MNDEKCFSDNHAFVVKNMPPEQFKELTKNQNSFKKAMERFNRNKGCMVYEVDSNAMEDAKPVSREFLEECAEVARKYRKDTEDNKCSDCSRRKRDQIGYRDGENINIEKIKAINKEMKDYLFEKYCIEGFDEILDGIFKKYLELCKDINVPSNDDWIPVEERFPEEHNSMFAKFKGTDMWGNAMFEKKSDEVNVTIELEDGTRKTTTSYTLDGKWKVEKEQRVVKKKVTAWQTLPEPYKLKKQD